MTFDISIYIFNVFPIFDIRYLKIQMSINPISNIMNIEWNNYIFEITKLSPSTHGPKLDLGINTTRLDENMTQIDSYPARPKHHPTQLESKCNNPDPEWDPTRTCPDPVRSHPNLTCLDQNHT